MRIISLRKCIWTTLLVVVVLANLAMTIFLLREFAEVVEHIKELYLTITQMMQLMLLQSEKAAGGVCL